MTTRFLFLLALAIALGAPACDSSDDDNGEPGGATPITGGFDSNFATSSDWFTLMAGPVVGVEAHGVVQIWYTANVQSLVEAGGPYTVPMGTTAIKESRDDEGNVSMYTVMRKMEAGYDAANNDWYYEARDPDGNVIEDEEMMAPGRNGMCIGCHAAAASTDYLAGTQLR